MKTEKNNRDLALIGILGGPVLFAAVMLSVLFGGFSPDASGMAAWGSLPLWRTALSAVLGAAGTVMLLCGMWSGYRLVRTRCHHVRRSMYLAAMGARSLQSLSHFLFFCLPPLAVHAGADGGRTAALLTGPLLPAAVLCVAAYLVSTLFSSAALLSGDVHVSRNPVILNGAVLGLIGVLFFFLMKEFAWRSVFLGLFCLGDSMQMSPVFGYWRKKARGGV